MDCYRVALSVARWAAGVRVPTARRHLRDQLTRAADSIVLNLAEGVGRGRGDARRNHFRIAAGSASEVGAIIDLLQPADGEAMKRELLRVSAMLAKLG